MLRRAQESTNATIAEAKRSRCPLVPGQDQWLKRLDKGQYQYGFSRGSPNSRVQVQHSYRPCHPGRYTVKSSIRVSLELCPAGQF